MKAITSFKFLLFQVLMAIIVTDAVGHSDGQAPGWMIPVAWSLVTLVAGGTFIMWIRERP